MPSRCPSARYDDPALGGPAPGYAPTATGGYYAPASAAASRIRTSTASSTRQTGERIDGHEDPAADPRLHDRRYDGRLAADWVDPREDDRVR